VLLSHAHSPCWAGGLLFDVKEVVWGRKTRSFSGEMAPPQEKVGGSRASRSFSGVFLTKLLWGNRFFLKKGCFPGPSYKRGGLFLLRRSVKKKRVGASESVPQGVFFRIEGEFFRGNTPGFPKPLKIVRVINAS